jgi:acetyltransferase-like isoleucine patch superfamily enzyme
MTRLLLTFLRIILFVPLWIGSKVRGFGLLNIFRSVKILIYTEWKRFFIGEIGTYSSVAYPCSIEGGGGKNIRLGYHTNFQRHSVLGCWVRFGMQTFSPSITIGDYCTFGEYNQITCCNKITVGNGLLTGRYVLITDNSHGGLSLEESEIPPIKRDLISKGELVIGNNVWIGDKVTIIGNVHIGDNAIIAANAVVNKDVPSNCLVAGVPAIICKQL